MDILRQLTLQFRAQDINDRSSASSSLSSSSSSASSAAARLTSILQMKDDNVVDSGTASDEEEEEEEEEVSSIFMSESRAGADDLNEVPIEGHLLNSPNLNAFNSVPTSAQHSPTITSPNFLSSTSSSSPFSSTLVQDPTNPFPSSDHPSHLPSRDGRLSATSSDYERCSLNFEVSSSEELERHSSEEELGRINRDERRKRSRLSDDSSVFSDDDNDDDDEVDTLFRRHGELLLSVRLAQGLDGASNPGSEGVCGGGGGGRGLSPRKRLRRDCWGMMGANHNQRPSLDFYKMQKTCMIRKHNTLNRPRLVKLWIVNGSQRPSKTTFDPSPFCFRSLSWTPRNTGNDSPHQTR